MRTKLLALLLFGTVSMNAQSIGVSYGSWQGADVVREYSDGRVEVKGDSLTAIKALLKVIEDMANQKEEAMIAVKKSVEWSNTVPDYWKKNRQWNIYLIHISKYGFKLEKHIKK